MMDMLEEQPKGEKYPNLEVGKDVGLSYDRKKNWKDTLEDNTKNKGEVYSLQGEVYKK